MQKSFGQGDNGAYNTETSNSWGPAMGSEYTFNGQKRVMQYYDNVDAFFKTGLNLTESISFSQQYDKTSIYASLNRMDDSSKIPGATLDRTNLTLRAFIHLVRMIAGVWMQRYSISIRMQITDQ